MLSKRLLPQVKTLIQQDPKQVRALLIGQPNLARALFQAQVALGMLPLPQTNGGLPPGAGPSPQHPQQPMPPQQQQQQAPLLQHNAMAQVYTVRLAPTSLSGFIMLGEHWDASWQVASHGLKSHQPLPVSLMTCFPWKLL